MSDDILPVTGVFIGGPKNGQHARLPRADVRVRIAIPDSAAFISSYTGDSRPYDPVLTHYAYFDYALYRCMQTPETLVALYTPEEMDEDTMLLALLSRYVTPPHDLQALQPHPSQPWK